MDDPDIQRLRETLVRQHISAMELVGVYGSVRVVLEKNAWKDNYPLLAAYADWSVHPHLDRCNSTFAWLETVNQGLIRLLIAERDGDIDGRLGYLNRAVVDALGYEQLRKEFVVFCAETGGRQIIFDSPDRWRRFYETTVGGLLNRRVGFPFADDLPSPRGKLQKDTYERIRGAAEKANAPCVTGLWLASRDIPHHGKVVHAHVEVFRDSPDRATFSFAFALRVSEWGADGS